MSDYVPMTYYENYNIQNQSPNMMFIHNPYDMYIMCLEVLFLRIKITYVCVYSLLHSCGDDSRRWAGYGKDGRFCTVLVVLQIK